MTNTYRRKIDEHHFGKKFRDGHRQMTTPQWWIKDYMTKPRRRESTRLCYSIIKGEDPENIAWPLGNKKPHIYYW